MKKSTVVIQPRNILEPTIQSPNKTTKLLDQDMPDSYRQLNRARPICKRQTEPRKGANRHLPIVNQLPLRHNASQRTEQLRTYTRLYTSSVILNQRHLDYIYMEIVG